jgi:hypothetical protein
MQLDDFADSTKRVIRKDGFEGFLPTLYLPQQYHIMVLEGVPPEKQSEIRTIALEWARDKAADEQEFLLAFREDEASFRVIQSLNGELSEKVFPAS